jgi:hypothetical protein
VLDSGGCSLPSNGIPVQRSHFQNRSAGYRSHVISAAAVSRVAVRVLVSTADARYVRGTHLSGHIVYLFFYDGIGIIDKENIFRFQISMDELEIM